MPACTFFGSAKANPNIYPRLLAAIEKLIADENVQTFYVGDKGKFDFLAQKALRELRKRYPINCCIVLAYLPGIKSDFEEPFLLDTLYPEGLEKTPRRFAIDRRNRWMINNSSFVVSYPSPFGNSLKYTEIALRKKKTVIKLEDGMTEICSFKK